MYLGFTATPYAIIMHQRRKKDSREYRQYGPDIFPDNYLLVLDDPDSYCGGDIFLGRNQVVVRKMTKNAKGGLNFGKELLHLPAFDGVGSIFNDVDDSEIESLVPDKSLIPIEREHMQDYEYAQMNESLEQAIDDFILSGAARAQRGDGDKPCTMMINVSHRAAVHFDLRNCVLEYLSGISEMYSNGMQSGLLKRLMERWNQTHAPLISAFNGIGDEGPDDLTLHGAGKSTDKPTRILARRMGDPKARPQRTTSFEDISPFIKPFLLENSSPSSNRVLIGWSKELVDCDQEPSVKAIVYGGYNLGRGLTFKGMVSTYLLRSHGDMSGLMQMQRWCGHRGEEGERLLDLVRIHMQNDARLLLQRMLTIEKKNRFTLGTYVSEGKEPAEFKTVMEQDPDFPLMSAAKQGELKEIGGILSASTKTQRTFGFTKSEDNEILENRVRAGTFIEDISAHRYEGHGRGGHLFRDVPTSEIEQLLADWNCVETTGFRKFEIQSWIKRLSDWNKTNKGGNELKYWTVYLPSRQEPSPETDRYVDGFDPDTPMEIGGEQILPFSYTLDRGTTDRLKVISSPSWTQIDEELFFNGEGRPSSHGLMLISPILNPMNRKRPGGNLSVPGTAYPRGGSDLHKAGRWPNLLSLGFWFPYTEKINTVLVEHG